MHIAFDAKRLFLNDSGLGSYSRNLVRSLHENYPEHTYSLFTPRVKNNIETEYFIKNFPVYTPTEGLSKFGWRTKGVTKDLQKHKIDVFHGLSHEIPLSIRKTGVKSVVTIHDLIFKFYPQDFKFVDKQVYNFKWKYACKNADAIIATSEATKNDIIKYFNTDPDKIHVVYQTASEDFDAIVPFETEQKIREKYNLPKSYLLFVGALLSRKNVLSLVKAYNLIHSKIDLPLIIVGRGKEYKNEIQQYIIDNKLQEKVRILSTVENNELACFYQQAELFIYPSKYEGFGIPIVEALKSNTNVLTSNCSCMPEVGGEAATYCDPFSTESIANGILEALNVNMATHINSIREQARKFSLQNFAKQTMYVYSQLK